MTIKMSKRDGYYTINGFNVEHGRTGWIATLDGAPVAKYPTLGHARSALSSDAYVAKVKATLAARRAAPAPVTVNVGWLASPVATPTCTDCGTTVGLLAGAGRCGACDREAVAARATYRALRAASKLPAGAFDTRAAQIVGRIDDAAPRDWLNAARLIAAAAGVRA